MVIKKTCKKLYKSQNTKKGGGKKDKGTKAKPQTDATKVNPQLDFTHLKKVHDAAMYKAAREHYWDKKKKRAQFFTWWSYQKVKKQLKKNELTEHIIIPKSWDKALQIHRIALEHNKNKKKSNRSSSTDAYTTLIKYINAKKLNSTHTLNTDTLKQLHTNFGRNQTSEDFTKNLEAMLNPNQKSPTSTSPTSTSTSSTTLPILSTSPTSPTLPSSPTLSILQTLPSSSQ